MIVVGAGVVGLSCAVRLLEAGHDVAVLARDLPLETTSSVAAALWYPYRALPQDRVTAWAATTYDVLGGLAAEPDTGVVMRAGTEVFRAAAARPVVGRRRARPAPRDRDLPAPYVDGWSFTAPVVEMPVYLAWLARRVVDLGGSVTRLALAALPAGGDLVVNCAGLGARGLAGDPTVVPVRGQVVVVEQVGIDRWWLDGAGPDVRRAALARRRRRRHRRRGGVEPDPLARRSARRSWPGPPGWCRSSPARACCAPGWGCGRCDRRSGWSARAG